MSTLSWRALLSEAWRDCLSGTARVGILTILATAMVGGIICADAFSLRSVSVEAASFRVHLGSVRILQAQGGIEGATCDALSRIPGVRAGAVRSVESGLTPLALPASSLTLYEVTPGIASLLGTTTADPTGILLPEQVAEDLGTPQGTLLPPHTRTGRGRGHLPVGRKRRAPPRLRLRSARPRARDGDLR